MLTKFHMVPFSSIVYIYIYIYRCYICKIYYISPITLVKHGFLFPLRQSHGFLAGLELTMWSKQDPELLMLLSPPSEY